MIVARKLSLIPDIPMCRAEYFTELIMNVVNLNIVNHVEHCQDEHCQFECCQFEHCQFKFEHLQPAGQEKWHMLYVSGDDV